ncbi:hypothetical protein L3X38_021218 [Prunus dulcis]|uniref:Transposable element protein n=1 Tax=Prunus dulcis TaxID=3755 RepID=A0AAD4VVI8_PRUDU|nr:hypothetical protein L3X38_021218 [Prunus dulcis]
MANEVLFNAMEDIAKQIWEKLRHMFAGKSLSNKLFLKEELLNLHIKEGGNMMKHLSTFNRCIAYLKRMDMVYITKDKTSLPQSYKNFLMTLMFCKSTLNFEELVQDILMHH